MNCPTDGTTLLMSERQGIEIDYCPQCRGVWLDRGELDKILERAKAESDVAAAPEVPQAPQMQAPQQPLYGQQQPYSQQPPQQPRYDDRGYDDRRGHDSRDDRRYDSRDNRGYDSRQGDYRKKKKSPFDFLGDIFEG
ncbi:hypothetical protein G7068_10770 [Leucobacter viscericola]|uniref:Transcription factor zinc-finger domain-containing protein n=1 Tax=Leucobacter viscericola TaxID=2714935 RepID=A0A6G7XGI9_9MICO|nr:zf-TFIIB domain-containing protein [Leucobacter viscericola]QIK63622.1 hypothetical protein G7068_10770 [Leucobacter viscericola]